MMIRTLSLLVLLFVFPILAAAETPAAEVSTTVAWRMSLGADGKISALEPRSNTIAALREKLEPVVRSWEFEPGTINGQPASTETILSVDVSLLPEGDKTLAIRVDDVRTGGDIENQRVPSSTASMLAKLKENGGVVQRIYEISYDQLGAITKVSVLEGSTKVKGRFPDHTEKSFRHWKFVPERVAGIGIPGKVVISFCFSIIDSQRKEGPVKISARGSIPAAKLRSDRAKASPSNQACI